MELEPTMKKEYYAFEDTIERKHVFGFSPKYQAEFSVNLKPRIAVEVAQKTFEALVWDIVFMGESRIEAKRHNEFGTHTNKITVTTNSYGKLVVKSESLGNEFWDMGRNSMRVKLFIHAFQETLKEYDQGALDELETEVEIKDKWDDYEIPESLPAPKKYREPQVVIPAIGLGIVSLALAYVIAFLSLEGLYVIGLFEIGAGYLLAFSLKYLLKLGNFIDLRKTKFMLGLAVFLTFFMVQVFEYQLIMSRSMIKSIGFSAFMEYRFEHGLNIKDLNLGSIGLVILWVLQLVLTYTIAYVRILPAILKIVVERVPKEVIEFVGYHIVKGKNEISIKQELSQKGWKSDLEHQMVFEAIGGVHSSQEWNRG